MLQCDFTPGSGRFQHREGSFHRCLAPSTVANRFAVVDYRVIQLVDDRPLVGKSTPRRNGYFYRPVLAVKQDPVGCCPEIASGAADNGNAAMGDDWPLA